VIDKRYNKYKYFSACGYWHPVTGFYLPYTSCGGLIFSVPLLEGLAPPAEALATAGGGFFLAAFLPPNPPFGGLILLVPLPGEPAPPCGGLGVGFWISSGLKEFWEKNHCDL